MRGHAARCSPYPPSGPRLLPVTLEPRSPARRVILLGASNLVLGFSTIVESARSMWGWPVEIMAAMGFGRSFGQNSWFLGRKIPGIFPCALWQDLRFRPPLPTAALLTDIGNDLLYGVSVDQLLEWIEGCLDRLADVGAETLVTQLPLSSLERVGEARFRFFRALFFPSSRITLPELKSSAELLDERLVEIGARRKIPIISVSNAWYGFDPIHLKPGTWSHTWPTIMSGWGSGGAETIVPRGSSWRWAYLNCLAPAERSVWSLRRRCRQPCGQLADGTIISLY